MTGNRNLSVGLFITAALLIGFVLTIWITGKRGTEVMDHYSVLVENDVSGLAVGGPVFFMGVKVGEVENTVIVPGDPAMIRVDLKVAEATPVNGGTWATLAPQGITGVSVINLANDPGATEHLARIEGQPYPVIPYRDSGFSAILSSAPAVLSRMEVVLENANALLNEENRASVTATLANIRTLSASLAAQEATLARLPEEISAVMGNIDEASGQLVALLEGTGPGVTRTVENLETGTRRLAAMTERLELWSLDHEAELDSFAEAGLSEFPRLVTDARETVRELEKLLAELREEPSSLVHRTRGDPVPVEN